MRFAQDRQHIILEIRFPAGNEGADHVALGNRQQQMGRMRFLVVDRHAPGALPPQTASGDLLQPAVGRLVVGSLNSHTDALAGENRYSRARGVRGKTETSV